MKCTKWNKYIKDNTISHQYKPYSYIGELFKDIYNKATGNGSKMDYYNSKESYKKCYGRNPDPCDDRYTFNKDCMKTHNFKKLVKPKGQLFPTKLSNSQVTAAIMKITI